MALEVLLKDAVEWIATATEAVSTLVIAAGVLQAAIMTVRMAFGRLGETTPHLDPRESIRLQLGRSLALALEFQLAADILKTAVTPTWDDIGKVAAIILLRTILNFFLEREIEGVERHRQAMASRPHPES
jgi:uncharacterized membrane protein